MNYKTIAEVYEANDKINENFKAVVENLDDEQQNFLPEGEKWTIAQIVEHMAKVEVGMTRISAKLVEKAKAAGKTSDGKVKLSDSFLEGAAKAVEQKLEAPEMVRPQGNQSIAESVSAIEENRKYLEELRPTFETVEAAGFTFPHPSFGEMTAHDWLALIGGHKFRHTKQIQKILSKK